MLLLDLEIEVEDENWNQSIVLRVIKELKGELKYNFINWVVEKIINWK